jgi:hypothetical protein
VYRNLLGRSQIQVLPPPLAVDLSSQHQTRYTTCNEVSAYRSGLDAGTIHPGPGDGPSNMPGPGADCTREGTDSLSSAQSGPAIHHTTSSPHRQTSSKQTMEQATHPAQFASTDLGVEWCASYPAASGGTVPPRYPTTSVFLPRREDPVSVRVVAGRRQRRPSSVGGNCRAQSQRGARYLQDPDRRRFMLGCLRTSSCLNVANLC